ncbi:MAG: VWA domain-containing protein, partial [Planctomycetota bacterium]|nr:VWA domain-containing protein [Planctomycetota bacterium]
DPKANKGDRTQIGTVADWDETDRYLRIVVDGDHGYAPEPETRLPEEPRFLPDVLTGERAVFLVPEDFISLELRCEFPNANPPDGGIIHPKPLIFSLQGARPAPTKHEPILEIDDDVFHVSLVAQSLVDEFAGAQAGEGQKFLVLDFVVANSGEKGEFFQAPEQIQYVNEKGSKQNLDPVTSLGPYRPGSLVWIPTGERRAFQVVFGVAESDRHRLSYTGISRADILNLSPSLGEPASGEEPVVKRDPKDDPRKPEEPPEPEQPPEPDEAAKPEEPSKPEQPPEPEETEKPEQPPRPEEKPTAGAVARKWDFGAPLGRSSFIPREETPAWLSERFSRSVDLAYYAFDTQIEIDPPGELPHVVARQRRSLIDRDTWGYEQRGSTTYTLTLLGGRVVSLDAVGIHLRYAATGMRILIEGEGETGQFRRLASETGIDQEGDGLRVYEFDPQRVGRLRIRIESEGEHRPTEIMAFEARSEDRAESILSGGGANIASYSLGGVVMHFSEKPTTVFNLIDSDPTTYTYVTGKGGRSTTVVLAFAGNREAKVRAISLRPAFNKDRSFVEELPVRIRVFASTEDPFEGYRLLGEFAVSEAEEEQIFEVPPGAPARFVKVEMIPRPGATYVSLGEISVYEGSGQGYVSVLFRGGESDLARMTEEKGLDDLVTMPEFAGEKEPNDDEEEAQAVRIQSWIRAQLESGGDRDLFRFTLEHSEDEQPVIEVHMAPFLRAKARILDLSGKQVLDLEIQRAGGTFARLLPSLPPGDYILEVTPLPVFLLLAYDSSGSMGKTFETSQEAIRQWADHLPSGFQVALATSARDKETRKDLTIICPFTAEGEKLKEAVEEMFAIDGSSAWYTIVRDLLEYADENVPYDAVESVVLIADGNGSGEFRKMWARLRQTRARFYTIGFGDVGQNPDRATSWNGARGLFNVAWYRSGRYFEPHTVEDLVTTYDRIFEDLQVAPEYAFRISLKEREEGTLVTEPPPPGENRPILFILDASGSMLAELDDGTKLDIAKSVMVKVVESLPEKSQVGLRVYGHRHRTLDRDKASKDSELVIRIGTLDKPAFLGVLSGIRARGGTPLAYSLEEAASDIRGVKDPRVILITDGLESFRGKPVKAAASLGAELTVVGFDIEEPMDQENLKRMAAAAGGTYTSASDAGSLVESIQEALSPSVFYVILDGQDREVARGKFGDRHTILEGRYTCVLQLAGSERRVPITIRPGAEAHIRLPAE